jgi:hypothetical protein
MRLLSFFFIIIFICFFSVVDSKSQVLNNEIKINDNSLSKFFHNPADSIIKKNHKNAIDVSPLSPVFDIYAIHYIRRLYDKGEFITGASYMHIKYDCGNTNSVSIILGYRQYLWKNFHIEYELWPDYDKFYEKNEDKYYEGFDFYNEFRLGYLIDFKIGKLPCYVNVQWPFGFGLYGSNKPQSFKDEIERDRFFYKAILIFTGIKF